MTNYREISRSKSLDDLARLKTERLLKKLHMEGTVIWTFSRLGHAFVSEIYLTCLNGEFYAKSLSDNFFKTLEPNLSKLEDQINEFRFQPNI